MARSQRVAFALQFILLVLAKAQTSRSTEQSRSTKLTSVCLRVWGDVGRHGFRWVEEGSRRVEETNSSELQISLSYFSENYGWTRDSISLGFWRLKFKADEGGSKPGISSKSGHTLHAHQQTLGKTNHPQKDISFENPREAGSTTHVVEASPSSPRPLTVYFRTSPDGPRRGTAQTAVEQSDQGRNQVPGGPSRPSHPDLGTDRRRGSAQASPGSERSGIL